LPDPHFNIKPTISQYLQVTELLH